MFRVLKIPLTVLVVSILVTALVVSGVHAAKIEEGTVVTADNIEQLKDDTFQGKRLGDMIPKELETLVKQEGWDLTLSADNEYLNSKAESPLDQRFYDATEKYKGQIELNTESKLYDGEYMAGVPFPDVDLDDDPNAGFKLHWNWFLGQPFTRSYELGPFAFPLIDDETGLDRNQHWYGMKYYLKNQYGNLPRGNPVENPGKKMIFKRLMFAQYPNDIAGIGTYIERFTDGRLDNSWVYINALRRTRRLTGGAWMDPIDGSDWLSDDFQGMSGNPSWYKDIQYKGTRTILRAVRQEGAGKPWDKNAGSLKDQFRVIKMSEPNYCAPSSDYYEWVPATVYVIEATMPKEHPYSKRVLHLDPKYWDYPINFNYDKKGKFWKVTLLGNYVMESKDGVKGLVGDGGMAYDIKAQHCSVYMQPENQPRPPGITSDKVSLTNLKRGEAPRP